VCDRHHHVGRLRLRLAQQLLGKRAAMQDHSAAQLFRNFDCTGLVGFDHLSAHYWLARLHGTRDIKADVAATGDDHPPGDWLLVTKYFECARNLIGRRYYVNVISGLELLVLVRDE